LVIPYIMPIVDRRTLEACEILHSYRTPTERAAFTAG